MIQVSNLSKSYGTEPLFDEATFSITYGERLGLIGRNGHGKTTLLKILAGTEELDSGKVIYPDNYKVGVLSQHLHFTEPTVLDEACLGLPELEGGWKETYKAEAVLLGLGFSKDDFEKSPQALSGGYQIRLNLTKLLISEPNLLLLDEPTNYLDIVSMRWLTTFMKEWPGELLIITHDHHFMDSITTHTLGIHRAKVRKIAGGTKKFYNQIEIEEEVHEQSRLNQEKKIQQAEVFIRTFRAKASKAKAVQSRIKAVEKMDRKEKLDQIYDLDFDFNYFESPAKKLLEVENLGFGYEKGGELLFSGLKFTVNAKDRIAVIGKNGKGKSTLLNLIAGNLKPLEGEIRPSPNMRLGFFGQTNIERLDPNRTIEEELLSCTPSHNRTVARCIAGAMMFEGDSALKKIKVLSGGE
jgi:ATP-binding cassette subfamily F protein 3